jgi:hypothetical protein
VTFALPIGIVAFPSSLPNWRENSPIINCSANCWTSEQLAVRFISIFSDPICQLPSRKLDLSQQSSHDAEPFCIERLYAHGLTSPTVPVCRVALIAFFAMQVGMYPRALHAFVLLGRFVCSRPIAFGIPPQSDEGVRESGWWLGSGEGFTKFVQGHFESVFRTIRYIEPQP